LALLNTPATPGAQPEQKKRKERRKKELIITHFTGQAKNLL
jgi:hypothetical protein